MKFAFVGLGAFILIACSSGTSSADGANGTDGSSCTVAQTSTGAKITCSDGTSATINNGTNTSACSVVQTAGGAKITCPDGSSATVTNGTNGTNGSAYDPATSGTRLTPKTTTWTGADGSKLASPPYSFHDTTLNITCGPMMATDSVVRCLPSQTGGISYYADSGCTAPAAYFLPQTCDTPAYISVPTAYNYCETVETGVTVYTLTGSALTTFYSKSGANCTAVAITAPYTAFALGAVVPPSTFVFFTGP